MINVTDQIKGSDTHLKTAGSKITRYDMLENKLEQMVLLLNEKKKIRTVVYDNTGKEKEFVEEVSGTLDDAKEILAYYNENFIRIAHEYCLILRKDEPLILDYMITKQGKMDLRDSLNITWKDLVASVMESLGGKSNLENIYKKLEGYKKTSTNQNWKAKVRQTLQINPNLFKNIERGIWAIA